MQFVSDLNFLIKMQSVIKVLSLTKTQEIGHLFYRAGPVRFQSAPSHK